MTEKSDFIRIASPGMLSVASRKESSQNQYDQQKKKKENKKQIEINPEAEMEEFDIEELVEFGRIVSKKRNQDMRITKQELQGNAEEEMSIGTDDGTEETERTSALDTETERTSAFPTELSPLLDLYQKYYLCVCEESKIITTDDIDAFDDIIKQKDFILDQIDIVLKTINFDEYKNNSPKDENKTKANEILSEIHFVINKIMRQEDENSVELQSLKERMKLDIIKQERGAKAVSQYGQSLARSHFIDKKT